MVQPDLYIYGNDQFLPLHCKELVLDIKTTFRKDKFFAGFFKKLINLQMQETFFSKNINMGLKFTGSKFETKFDILIAVAVTDIRSRSLKFGKIFCFYRYKISKARASGIRCTFEFPGRVNLSGPSLYCTWLYGQNQPVQQG